MSGSIPNINQIVSENVSKVIVKKRPGPKSKTQVAVQLASTTSVQNAPNVSSSNTENGQNHLPNSSSPDSVLATGDATVKSPDKEVTFTQSVQDQLVVAPVIGTTKKRPGPKSKTLLTNRSTPSTSPTRSPLTQISTQTSTPVRASTSYDSPQGDSLSTFEEPLPEISPAGPSGKDLSSMTTKKRKSTPTSIASKKRKKRLTHEDLLNMDDPDYSKEFNDFIKSIPINIAEDEYLTYIPRRALNLSEFNHNICCKGCNKSFHAFHSGADFIFPSKEYYIHCIEQCQAYQHVKCNKCYHNFLDQDDYESHLAYQCLNLFKKKILVLRLKMPWMPRQLYYDLLERKLNSKVKCYASILGCNRTFECQMNNQKKVLPGLELYVHCIDECTHYSDCDKMKHCEVCSFKYLNEDDYKKYDPCAK